MHLFLVFLIGLAAGLVFSVRYRVVALAGGILCAWGLIAFSSTISQSGRGFLDTVLSAAVVAVALQFGYMAGLVFQTIWESRATKSDTESTKSDTQTSMTRRGRFKSR
jgi:hypothetical protein